MRYTRWTSRGQRTGQVGSAAEEGEEPRTLLNFPFFADSFHVQETEDGSRRSHVHLAYLRAQERKRVMGMGDATAAASSELCRHCQLTNRSNFTMYIPTPESLEKSTPHLYMI